MSDTVDEIQNNQSNTEDGLRKLNKELLSRNGELIKRLNRMKTERDNFEQLFIDWKKINKDAAEALNLLQKEKKSLQSENNTLHQQINDYKLEIKSLKLQNNERMEQCNLLLRRCNEYKANQSNQSNNSNGQSHNNYNTLKFNYQQKKNEMDQILFQIQKLFNFCHTNYPQIYNNYNQQNMYHLNDIQEYEYNDGDQSDDDDVDDDGFDDDFSTLKHRKSRKKIGRFTAKTPKKHRSTKSLSDFDKNVFRKRRSLNYIYENKKHKDKLNKMNEKQNMKKKEVVNIMINNNKPKTMKQSKIVRKTENENVDRKISPELLGPTTSYNQYDNKRSDPFGRTLSSHSFFSEQRYRYNQVQLNMTNNSKLWSKRDSLTRKRKQPRINAIPSSAGNTPLTTPQQSYRGKLSDDDDDDEHDMYFDEDPHQKYLEMMGDKNSTNHNNNKPKPVSTTSASTSTSTASASASTTAMATRSKLTDKKTIHDLFDMLQQQTLSSSSPATHSTNSTMTTNTENTSTSNDDMDAIREFYDDQLQNNSDAQLVPLPEPSDSSSDSSDSD